MPRLVCEHCGYDLTGTRMYNEQYLCPECGKGTRPWAREQAPTWWFGALGLCTGVQAVVGALDGVLGTDWFLTYGFVGPLVTSILWFRAHRYMRRGVIWAIGLCAASVFACQFVGLAVNQFLGSFME